MTQVFKDVLGYDGRYQISDSGNVLSITRGKLLKSAIDKDGYINISLFKNGKSKKVRAHRLVALEFIPNPNNYPIVDHIDGNKSNNHYLNLRWCTNQQNLNFDNVKTSVFGRGISTYKGVYWHNIKNKWVIVHYNNGKRRHVGYAKTDLEGHIKYQEFIKQLQG